MLNYSGHNYKVISELLLAVSAFKVLAYRCNATAV